MLTHISIYTFVCCLCVKQIHANLYERYLVLQLNHEANGIKVSCWMRQFSCSKRILQTMCGGVKLSAFILTCKWHCLTHQSLIPLSLNYHCTWTITDMFWQPIIYFCSKKMLCFKLPKSWLYIKSTQWFSASRVVIYPKLLYLVTLRNFDITTFVDMSHYDVIWR